MTPLRTTLWAAATLALAGASAAETTELTGGRWYRDGRFVDGTMYIVDGRLTRSRPVTVDYHVDVTGFVVPPFGEAHTHTLVYRTSRIEEFLGQGIYYAHVMAVDKDTAASQRHLFNRPDSVDVVFAIAAFTAPEAHPTQIGRYATIDEHWLTLLDTAEDLEAKWPGYLENRPDWTKVFLLHADRYMERRSDPEVFPRYRGMDPELVESIVRRSHEAGIPVAAHVRTVEDLRLALAAGVDRVAHMPGFDVGPPSLESLDEVFYLRSLDVLSDAELLELLCVDTPRGIFPQREIGTLEDGAEASFLVLEGDPTTDLENIRRIRLCYKEGRPLDQKR